jgi:hypothetical protein
MNPHVLPILGFFLGFVLASFLISWHAKNHESENIRLRTMLENYRKELEIMKASKRAQQKTVQDDFGI